MRQSFVLRSSLSVLLLCGCATSGGFQGEPQRPAPTVLAHVERPMQTPGFWISRQAAPDQILLSENEIVALNAKFREENLISDLNVFGTAVSGRTLRDELTEAAKPFYSRKYFLADGKVADTAFLDPIRHNMFLDGMGDTVTVRYGFVVHYADQRILPTDMMLLEAPGDFDFDQLQNSAVDVGAPVVILHESRDGNWLYAQAESVPGWIKKELVAVADREAVVHRNEAKDFVVTVAAKTDIFLDEGMRQHYDYAQMGTRFELIPVSTNQGIVGIKFPIRQPDGNVLWQQGFVREQDVHRGYLSYTPRTMIEQAFKLLNAPYGWGGMYGEQDCSRFLQQIFSTAGIALPRNSAEQAKAGKILARFDDKSTLQEKLSALNDEARGGVTLLGLKGHIMLFLGMVEGRPYVIHATWAYREREGQEQVARVINKVVVSDLSLGGRSSRGSLLERLRAITLIGR